MVTIVSSDGLPAAEAARKLLAEKLAALRSPGAGRAIRDALRTSVRRHFQARFPGSRHWSPDKVVDGTVQSGILTSGAVNVEVPGASRAYHGVTIRPKFRKHLSIPIASRALGKRPADFPDLFMVEKKDGTKLLAQGGLGGLAFLYVLKDKVFQRQDKTLMPSDETLADGAFSRLAAYLQGVK